MATKALSRPAVCMTVDDFGSYRDETGTTRQVKRFTWENVNNTSVQVINWGATITSIKFPDKNGKLEDIVTGFETIQKYLDPNGNPYYGASIGRVANRTAKGHINVEGVDYQLATNSGPNHLHGGNKGFDKVLWNYHVDGTKLVLTHLSKDMEEGYPGDVLATIIFELTPFNEFKIDYKAVVSKTTPVNLTNHSYFNLAGHGAGPAGLYEHEITINADRYTETDANLTASGNILSVNGTVLDFRVAKLLKDVIHKVPNSPGYDHNFCINKASSQEMTFVAKAYHKPSGRVLEVYSNQPGVQFYTGNFMPEDNSSQGKGATYKKHGAFCLETQIYPDAIHHANFPDVLVYPGQEYHHIASFKFLVQS